MPVLKIKSNGVWEDVAGVSGHTHTKEEITNFPSRLPASGGNADTVDGKHADDFMLVAEAEEQINNVLSQAKESGEFDGASGVYVGSNTPPDSANVWVEPDGEVSPTEEWEFEMQDGTIEEKMVVLQGTTILRVRQEDGSWAEVPALKGPTGNGIKSAVLNADYTLTLTFTDGTSYTTPSIRGVPGDPGYTPQKDVDYFDGKNGTSVTVSSVSESTADGGNNVVTFSDGNTVTIKNGQKGTDGKTPVKGTDYYTEADRTELISAINAALYTETWEFELEDGSIVTKVVHIG